MLGKRKQNNKELFWGKDMPQGQAQSPAEQQKDEGGCEDTAAASKNRELSFQVGAA